MYLDFYTTAGANRRTLIRRYFPFQHLIQKMYCPAAHHIRVHDRRNDMDKNTNAPSIDEWLKQAKADPSASKCGMYLVHNGIVRETAKAKVRAGEEDAKNVTGMEFSYDEEKVNEAIKRAYEMPGIYYIKVWLAEGRLNVGDDIMKVLIGGDIRPHVVDCLGELVGTIKNDCVAEKEIY